MYRELSAHVFILIYYLVVAVSAKGSDSEMCSRIFDISNRTIIKTTESINQGAKYLKSTKAKTRDECMIACCTFEGCNMAVLQEKADGDCYLFNCGTLDDFKCTFSVHEDHVSMGMMINRNDLQKTKVHEQAKHEMDLNLLKTQQDIQQQQQQQQNQDAVPEPEPEPAPTPAAVARYNNYNDDGSKVMGQKNDQSSINDVVRQRRPPLKQEDMIGNTDDSSSKSNDAKLISKPKSILNKNVAKPQRPFNSQTFKKPICTSLQWQCETNDQCIAIYDKCDGIAQCSDKSDEKNCDVKQQQDFSGSRPDVQVQQNPPPMWGNYYPADRPPQSNDFLRNDLQQQSDKNNRNQQQNANDYQNYDTSNQQSLVDNNQQRQNNNWPNNNNQQYQQIPNKQTNKIINNRPLNGGQTYVNQQNFRKPQVNQPPVTGLRKESETNVAVSIEHLDYGRGSTSLAAVMLGLGLAVLALLLLFISCRLRTARRRLRRGKVLDTDEGEYLINGMYL